MRMKMNYEDMYKDKDIDVDEMELLHNEQQVYEAMGLFAISAYSDNNGLILEENS